MSPIRLLILAILFYIVYRLLTGGRRTVEPDDRVEGKSYKEMPSDDVLVEDPVCKKLVPKMQAVKHQRAGQSFYFCSEECCRKFISQEGDGE